VAITSAGANLHSLAIWGGETMGRRFDVSMRVSSEARKGGQSHQRKLAPLRLRSSGYEL
jgi:hypothetical protein